MILLKAISNLPLDYTPTLERVVFKGISASRNFLPKLIVTDKVGAPIIGADITLFDGNNTFNKVSDSNGFVEIPDIPRGVNYVVTIKANGFKDLQSKFLLPTVFLENAFTMFKMIPVITTSKGFAINLNPTNGENLNYS